MNIPIQLHLDITDETLTCEELQTITDELKEIIENITFDSEGAEKVNLCYEAFGFCPECQEWQDGPES